MQQPLKALGRPDVKPGFALLRVVHVDVDVPNDDCSDSCHDRSRNRSSVVVDVSRAMSLPGWYLDSQRAEYFYCTLGKRGVEAWVLSLCVYGSDGNDFWEICWEQLCHATTQVRCRSKDQNVPVSLCERTADGITDDAFFLMTRFLFPAEGERHNVCILFFNSPSNSLRLSYQHQVHYLSSSLNIPWQDSGWF